MGQVRIFDQPHYDDLNRAREAVVSRLLGELKPALNLETAVDVGCGLGHFSGYLKSLGLNVLAVDGREQNVEEAQRRNPSIRAVRYNAEDTALKTLGTFDLVFCFGLLYHLENPLLAIRNLEAITGKVFFAEGVIYPGETPTMGLVDEGHYDDQGLNHLAFYPTDACLQKMLYRAGFGFVYRLALMPQHSEYQGSLDVPRFRTMLVASREFIASRQLELVREASNRLVPVGRAKRPGKYNFFGGLARIRRDDVSREMDSPCPPCSPTICATEEGRSLVFERHLVPVYLPRGMFERIVGVKRLLIPPKTQPAIPEPVINLYGDRQIEWAYIASRLPVGSGRVLDFGAGHGDLSILAIQKGHRVIALDLEENDFHWTHPGLERICGDLLRLPLPLSKFDFVINCSAVEHVGLSGRFGVAVSESDGDLAAMAKLREVLKPSGRMLMTVPCGRDAVIVPWHRVYGQVRLPKLLDGYEIEEECYWKKQTDNSWYLTDRKSALAYIPTGHPTKGAFCSYALACFVLRKRANL